MPVRVTDEQKSSGIKSIIPKDTSSLVVTTIATHPARNSTTLPWALGNRDGEEAFEDITYLVRINTCGGVAPADSLCCDQCLK
ncbi:hypothetical protein F8M41_017934 [Gigaspora margarita]|uniref:Uncharacterized protein n=1 Tax=Gigaspora margarita TaxID=4874 RepID=A0A8H4EUM4_GIGMA|nr:hypothetical protein F8M41_017934 [Gigaspora margarita]